MKPITLLPLTWLMVVLNLSAQDYTKPPEIVANHNATVVTSDVFRWDMGKKQGVFTGNVVTVAEDFKMKADEMTVFFSEGAEGKPERILARGNVTIEQSDRIAKSNQAEYIVLEDKMVLTGSPDITQKTGNHITGSTITIYRNANRMEVDGRSRMVLYSDAGTPGPTGSSPSPPAK